MKVEFRSSFYRDLRSIKDKDALRAIRDAIETIESSQTLSEVPHVKKLSGSGYFRIRVADHRLGIAVEAVTVTFIRCLHRREVYRYFP